jgi:ADP-ribosylglycohydrolase
MKTPNIARSDPKARPSGQTLPRTPNGLGFVLCLLVLNLSIAFPVRAEPIGTRADSGRLQLPLEIYHEKVYAAWLGQIVGNIYGLSYEFRFIGEAGPDRFPYGYGPALERVRTVDGAFSDDDTDIEYMYLLQMERHGHEPNYEQLAQAWMHHVRDKVWVANRAALNLMHAGYGPPLTGSRDLNPQWFQIDPQLVNEIWAVTAPGMIDYAVEKSAWAARITNDDFGIEPTMAYAAMYAAAFFEPDIAALIQIGRQALPPQSRFAAVIDHMVQLYATYPNDWQAARQEVAKTYYYGDSGQTTGELSHGAFDYNRHAWPAVDALLNGACGILALLYGQGDFQRTLDIASGLGFDADNQAATMSGLLGIIHGLDGIPEELLYPLGRNAWTRPFNDRYINVSRHDLPDASLQDLARRTAAQGLRVVEASGGRIISDGSEPDRIEIAPTALFTPPEELVLAPTLLVEVTMPFRFSPWLNPTPPASIRIVDGALPAGLKLEAGEISGRPGQPGLYPFTIEAHTRTGQRRVRSYAIHVLGANIASDAIEILVNPNQSPDDIEWIRDGQRRGRTFYNRSGDSRPQENHYGYRWSQPRTIGSLWLNTGLPEEWGGWFTSLKVEYLDASGQWRNVRALEIMPALDFDNSQWRKGSYIDHLLRFEPVATRAIRLRGDAGGIAQDERNGGEQRFYSALSELQVHPPH